MTVSKTKGQGRTCIPFYPIAPPRTNAAVGDIVDAGTLARPLVRSSNQPDQFARGAFVGVRSAL